MGDTPAADNALTDRLLRSWLRCRRKAWLDRHGNPAERRWTAHRNLLLDDQQRCFVALLPRKPGHGGSRGRAAGVTSPINRCWPVRAAAPPGNISCRWR